MPAGTCRGPLSTGNLYKPSTGALQFGLSPAGLEEKGAATEHVHGRCMNCLLEACAPEPEACRQAAGWADRRCYSQFVRTLMHARPWLLRLAALSTHHEEPNITCTAATTQAARAAASLCGKRTQRHVPHNHGGVAAACAAHGQSGEKGGTCHAAPACAGSRSHLIYPFALQNMTCMSLCTPALHGCNGPKRCTPHNSNRHYTIRTITPHDQEGIFRIFISQWIETSHTQPKLLKHAWLLDTANLYRTERRCTQSTTVHAKP